ncbi:hypothetical protein [Mycoplasmopsis arginini]|uniref:DUF1292 domain-containing protein n=2 Tax=Mycoplasmopsis TaxID=2767358 RepID=A0A0C6FNF2_MYCAR|nr:hypothetical protein [Mycoplasmopsis arginini]ENY69584.1 Hypothetical protein MARG_4810 [Mycoplasmopsis arginini 7264]MCY2903057.1 hypothetical protein [Mycoplasmopsis arginini QMP CG1-2758]MDI3348556.1 hypothetical protein [Mycoplasmopsis arginini]MDI3348614.1 hypothetical protein [Mycoplasmopsis arginini]MDI3349830.1 hypothetical protein [Mycoplasmopsis arginini]
MENNKRNKILVCSPEREIILEGDERLWVIFETEQNGERYLVLTDKDGIILTKEVNDKLELVEDEGEASILLDMLDSFLEENELIDENGNSFENELFEYEEEIEN